MKKEQKEEWKNLKRTIKSSKDNHKEFLKLLRDKEEGLSVSGYFENEYNERFVILDLFCFRHAKFAGDETAWEVLDIVDTKKDGVIGVKDIFTFSDEEHKILKKILK